MTAPIQLSTLVPTLSTQNTPSATSVSDVGKSFSKELGAAFNKINDAENNANNMVVQMTNGNVQNLHNVMIAVEKSEIMLRLAVNVRDKVIGAYQEVMRMQV